MCSPHFSFRPSADLGELACAPGVEVPHALRFLARRLDLTRARSRNLLSVILLDRSYIGRLIELGERDGETRGDEIAQFLAR